MKYDVAVCGAGPSGSTAARFLAENGYNVLLIDKDRFPRDKCCGGCLRPTITEFQFLKKILDETVETKCYHARIYNEKLDYIDYALDEPMKYDMRRINFDYALVKASVDAGAELCENTKVKNVKVSSENVTVRTDKDEIVCQAVIGAGGMLDPVARYLRRREGLPENWSKDEIGFVFAKEYEVDESFISDNYGKEMTTHIHLKPKGIYGYGWTFPKRQHLNVGFGAFWSDIEKIDVHDTFDYYLNILKKSSLFPKGIEKGRVKGALLPLRGPIRKTYSERILIVGDAAGFVSPISGDGIYYAIDSGRLSAQVLSKCLERNDLSSDSLSAYQDAWRKKWGGELKTLCYFADRMFQSLDRYINYARKDRVLTNHIFKLYTQSFNPTAMKLKIGARVLRDFLLYDVFRR